MERRVDAHYDRPGLGEAILDALRAAGRDPDRIGWTDLAPVDQFHTRGRDATLELAALAGVGREHRVLDVGGGIGGPARALAATYGCRVTVLDVTESYCDAGAMLTARAGLAHLVTFHAGDALAMPFDDAAFDVVWTQHSTMNVADAGRLYAGIRRVLRPGGRLAMHEVVAGDVQPIHFPVPWAPDPGISFLRTAEATRALVARAGFAEVAWRDVSDASLAWLRGRAPAAGPPRPLGLHLLLGRDFPAAVRNQTRNLAERRTAIVEAVFEAC